MLTVTAERDALQTASGPEADQTRKALHVMYYNVFPAQTPYGQMMKLLLKHLVQDCLFKFIKEYLSYLKASEIILDKLRSLRVVVLSRNSFFTIKQ